MKDGKRSKAAAPKNAKKASGQKTRSQKPSKSSVARPSGSKSSKGPRAASVKGSSSKKSSSGKALPVSKERIKTAADTGTNGREKRTGAAAGGDVITFTNPLIAAAFKRAVKKYPTAFKHLTD